MKLSFLPADILGAVRNLNINLLSELRLRAGLPVIACYEGRYGFLHAGGVSDNVCGALICNDVNAVLIAAMGGCVYSFAEQLKGGYIALDNGIRIGIAGEYVAENGRIKTIVHPTSLNVRIPHDIAGCADFICSHMKRSRSYSMLIFSRPGGGKTTMLRDIVRHLSADVSRNVLVLDVRNEIAAAYNLGVNVDVVRSCDKLSAAESAIRAMKPDIIITDELYGKDDISAVKFARDCGIDVVASSHIFNRSILSALPFECFAELRGVGCGQVIYDKDFNIICHNCVDYCRGGDALGR